jgi:purine-binding chemotaxis protein CheW
MANKKLAQKTRKKAEKKPGGPTKSPLPSFGLAKEIPGVRESGAGGQESEGRAANAGVRGEKTAPGVNGELHLVTFNLDQEEYGVEIGSVQEIIRVGQITPVPNAPKFISGVINLRGKVIPVMNLRKRLDLPDGALTKNSRIVVVESGVKILGMLVDSVSHVLRMPGASVDDPPPEADQMKAYVRGIGKVDSRLIMIMDLNRALEKDAATGAAAARQPSPERAFR